VAELADRIGYSVHHFTRMFGALAGLTPGQYIQGRFLSEAARRVLGGDQRLAGIAADFGFANYEVFSRAFKRQFGIGPQALRRQPETPVSLIPPCRLPPAASAGGLAAAEPSVIEEGELCIAGLAFWMDGGEKSFHRPWRLFQGQSGRVAGVRTPRRWYQHAAWADDGAAGMGILCALEIEAAAAQAQPALFTVRRLGAGRYLRFIHEGGLDTLAATYRFIYGVWLPGASCRLAGSWEFQRFADDPAGPLEICLPLEPGA
jgi:AraC family transcriptional regulator